jgi:hypothetical protein
LRHSGVLEPEEPALLEHVPPPPPCLDILTLLVQPPCLLRPVSELDITHQRAPQACCHRAGGLGDWEVGFRQGWLVKVDLSMVVNWLLCAGFC